MNRGGAKEGPTLGVLGPTCQVSAGGWVLIDWGGGGEVVVVGVC
jgi:hypothetical protein